MDDTVKSAVDQMQYNDKKEAKPVELLIASYSSGSIGCGGKNVNGRCARLC